MTKPFTDRELSELARVFAPGPAALTLFTRAGIPRQDLPGALGGVTSREYWTMISDLIAAGTVENGARRVLTAASEIFPANPIFQGSGTLRHVLFIGASPDRMSTLRPDRELREIIRRADNDRIKVRYRPAADSGNLAAVLEDRTDILHLACHGNSDSVYFEAPDGTRQVVSGRHLADTLRLYQDDAGAVLRGVVLAACHSAAVAELLRPYADTIIAHQGDLLDVCAIEFAAELYRVLPVSASLGGAARIAARHAANARALCGMVPDELVVFEKQEGANGTK
ncbi:CHAT domain-containing protein [Streptosporangiaceae bacterium NEAU-GS5]|nr:CHAT domain-containing protein [Streptosporangiaceae bacterium NEAU-GS5]